MPFYSMAVNFSYPHNERLGSPGSSSVTREYNSCIAWHTSHHSWGRPWMVIPGTPGLLVGIRGLLVMRGLLPWQSSSRAHRDWPVRREKLPMLVTPEMVLIQGQLSTAGPWMLGLRLERKLHTEEIKLPAQEAPPFHIVNLISLPLKPHYVLYVWD